MTEYTRVTSYQCRYKRHRGTSPRLHATCRIQIDANKYIFKVVIGIGNCVFEAIRKSGAITEMTAQELRQEICQYARDPKQGRTVAQAIKTYVGSTPNCDSISLDEYLNTMEKDRQWGGLFELTIAAFKYKTNIIVISQSNQILRTDIQKWIENTLPNIRDTIPWDKTIYLLHHMQGKPSIPMGYDILNHYATLFPIDNDDPDWNDNSMATAEQYEHYIQQYKENNKGKNKTYGKRLRPCDGTSISTAKKNQEPCS